MKKLFSTILLLLVVAVTTCMAQEKMPQIKFEKTVHNFGTFNEEEGEVTCSFKFTNTGSSALVIYQAIASCGCTVPSYPKEPIKPGESGEIKVTYNGAGKSPGAFEKVISLRANTKEEIYRLRIKGTMIGKK